MPVAQVVIVQVVEEVPKLLNLYLLVAPSLGTVKVRVQDGSAARVAWTPLAVRDVGETLQPETETVAWKTEPRVAIVTG